MTEPERLDQILAELKAARVAAQRAAESAALAEALDAVTHEHENPNGRHPGALWMRCHGDPDNAVHQTPAVVRRRHGLGAT